MKVVFDIECNGLNNPSEIWVIVCKDVETCHKQIFRCPTRDAEERARFLAYAETVSTWIGHNILQYDVPVVERLLRLSIPVDKTLDTFILSKLIDYPREKHSIRSYGDEFNFPKGEHNDFSKYSQSLEDYCVRDVDIAHRVYTKYHKYHSNPDHQQCIRLEHNFQLVVNSMSAAGFALDIKKATKLLEGVQRELEVLDKDILEAFPPRLKLIREVTPKPTKFGTISLASIPKVMRDNLHEFSVDAPFSFCSWVEFNPASHKQIITVLNEAGWEPVDKTDGHKLSEREYNKLKRQRNAPPEVALRIQELYNDLSRLGIYGWKVNENNLATLPDTAPPPARLLAKRILFEARRRTLTEWLSLVQDDGRVHGEFQAIGAWTHRMSHQKPNMANITNEFDISGNVKLLGKELRQCWIAPKDRLLVGVDAEGIQLRIFAHYIDDAEFTHALVHGDKKKKTDPHNLNQSVLGSVCKSRAAAKRFIFALLLGAGIGKLAEILECSIPDCEEALGRLLTRYTGFAKLKQEIIPADAARGWFTGIDGRRVRILGDTVGARRHLAMSGYLQNGEAVVVKTAAVIAYPQLAQYDSFFVDIIHDEDQVETPNDLATALKVAEILDESMREAGRILKLKCPIAGAYRNDHGDYSIGKNWWQTH